VAIEPFGKVIIDGDFGLYNLYIAIREKLGRPMVCIGLNPKLFLSIYPLKLILSLQVIRTSFKAIRTNTF